jgi:peptidyl-tRNA hydrolase, PTH1 family
VLWLVVGLGNPGRKYEKSRHNAGLRSVEGIAGDLGATFRRFAKADAAVAEATSGDAKLLIARPGTYMNESGRPVSALARYYRVEPENLIVVHDDVDLPIGRLRVKFGGSSGGHHGVESVELFLGNKNFGRVRIGVGRPVSDQQVPPDFLLETMSGAESKVLAEQEDRAAQAVLALIHEGLEPAMNRFNAAPKTETDTSTKKED